MLSIAEIRGDFKVPFPPKGDTAGHPSVTGLTAAVPGADRIEKDDPVVINDPIQAGSQEGSVGGSMLRSSPTSRGRSSEAVR